MDQSSLQYFAMPAQPLTNSTALITGAGTGIGRAIAIDLAARGVFLILVGRRVEPLNILAGELAAQGHASAIVPADVGDPAAARAMVRRALALRPTLDILINNAGHAELAPIDRHDDALIARAFGVNALGPAAIIAEAWPALLAAKGCLINITSIAGQDPFPGFFAYGAAKAAANTLIRAAHNEGHAQGLRAFAIAPGAVETPMLRQLFDTETIPASNTLAPGDISKVALECIMGQRDAQRGDVIVVAK